MKDDYPSRRLLVLGLLLAASAGRAQVLVEPAPLPTTFLAAPAPLAASPLAASPAPLSPSSLSIVPLASFQKSAALPLTAAEVSPRARAAATARPSEVMRASGRTAGSIVRETSAFYALRSAGAALLRRGAAPAALGSTFDGSGLSANESGDDYTPEPAGETASDFLDRAYQMARDSLRPGRVDIMNALRGLDVVRWSPHYLDAAESDRWAASHRTKLEALDRRVVSALKTQLTDLIVEGDFNAARERLADIQARYPAWSQEHGSVLRSLAELLPGDDARSEPLPPVNEPDRLAELMRDHIGAGEFRQAEYIATTLQNRHKDWAQDHAAELEAAREDILRGIYEAFTVKKARPSPTEARRLWEYSEALAAGRNLGFGFKHPAKQDPESMFCTIYSLYNAFEATIGFADPTMTLDRFVALVRTVLKDPTLGVKKGLSTHKVRTLLRALGFQLKVIEMQERLKRPFQEEELTKLFRPDQVVLAVFFIAQMYPDEKGIQREEHKGFIRDAYFSATEKRWIFVMMDPLIGRSSFYSWPEIKTFLHKIFIIKIDKPLAQPDDESDDSSS